MNKKHKKNYLKQVFRWTVVWLGIFTLFGIVGLLWLYANGTQWLPRVWSGSYLTSNLWNTTMTDIENKFEDTVSLSSDQIINWKKTFSWWVDFKKEVEFRDNVKFEKETKFEWAVSWPHPTSNSDLTTKSYVDWVVNAAETIINGGGGWWTNYDRVLYIAKGWNDLANINKINDYCKSKWKVFWDWNIFDLKEWMWDILPSYYWRVDSYGSKPFIWYPFYYREWEKLTIAQFRIASAISLHKIPFKDFRSEGEMAYIKCVNWVDDFSNCSKIWSSCNWWIYAWDFNWYKIVSTPSWCNNSTNPICNLKEDDLELKWSSNSSVKTDAKSSDGAVNTQKILSVDPNAEAAKYCNNMVYGWYDDWYLPSQEELKILIQNKDKVWGFDEHANYWSSNEVFPYEKATVIYTYNLWKSYSSKIYKQNVRCIRKS